MKEFCSQWQIQELAVFGPALRDDFSPDSDLDTVLACGRVLRVTDEEGALGQDGAR